MHQEMLYILILAFGAFVFGFAGFGFSLIVVPLLALILPTKTAVAFHFPFALSMVVYNSVRFGGWSDLGRLTPLFAGAIPAMPLGVLCLSYLPESFLKKTLAVFTAAAVVASNWGTLRKKEGRPTLPVVWGLVCGLISGLFQGAYTTGGPPAVLYIRSSVLEPNAVKGRLGVYFALTAMLTGLLYAYNGIFSIQWLTRSLLFSPAVILGFGLGLYCSRNISPRRYLAGVDALLLLSAVLLWWRSG